MILESGGSGGSVSIADVIGGLTQGSVLFGGSGGILDQDNSHLFYDKANTQLSLTSGAIGNTPLKIKAIALQTAPLQQWQDSSGTNLSYIHKNGSLFLKQPSGGLRGNPVIGMTDSPTEGICFGGNAIGFTLGGNLSYDIQNSGYKGFRFGNNSSITFSGGQLDTLDTDVGLSRYASGILVITDALPTHGGGGLAFKEIADPTAPATNHGIVYCRDNGSGKTQFCVRFPSGAIQVIATEP